MHVVEGEGVAGGGGGAGTVEGRVGTGRSDPIVGSKRRMKRIIIFRKVLFSDILVCSLFNLENLPRLFLI